ncbi:hypothetical protein [Nostoc sp. DedQUE07]|uniref:hypothetical protein n=1 Tax=Nostoc sp. DedQUE07 TaxID=3075392 RepID=UPI002AD50AD0|nr:hypothetical protein [Nostoc sp. DedQUE07]MDZ8131996.1 hypothetical protein [Nostoc sp. DedQUE07]
MKTNISMIAKTKIQGMDVIKESTVKPYAAWDVEWKDGREYAKGQVATKYGFVLVYSEKQDNRNYTYFRFIWDGTEYYRGIGKSYSQRYLVTLAHRYAEEIFLKCKRSSLKFDRCEEEALAKH